MKEIGGGRKSSLSSLGYPPVIKASRCKSFGLNISACLRPTFPLLIGRWAEIFMAEKMNCRVFLNPALHILCFPQSPYAFLLTQDLGTLKGLKGCLGMKLYPWSYRHHLRSVGGETWVQANHAPCKFGMSLAVAEHSKAAIHNGSPTWLGCLLPWHGV